jgi:hypothetical protein
MKGGRQVRRPLSTSKPHPSLFDSLLLLCWRGRRCRRRGRSSRGWRCWCCCSRTESADINEHYSNNSHHGGDQYVSVERCHDKLLRNRRPQVRLLHSGNHPNWPQGIKNQASTERCIGTNQRMARQREPAGRFGYPRRQPTLRFSADSFPRLATTS